MLKVCVKGQSADREVAISEHQEIQRWFQEKDGPSHPRLI